MLIHVALTAQLIHTSTKPTETIYTHWYTKHMSILPQLTHAVQAPTYKHIRVLLHSCNTPSLKLILLKWFLTSHHILQLKPRPSYIGLKRKAGGILLVEKSVMAPFLSFH